MTHERFVWIFSIECRSLYDQAIEIHAGILCHCGKGFDECGAAAAVAQDEVLGFEHGGIAVLFHGRDQLSIQIVEQSVEIQLAALPLFLHQCGGQLCGHIAGAAGHAQQPAVQNVRSAAPGGHGIGCAHAHVSVTMETNGHFDSFLHGFDRSAHLFREHTVGGIHRSDLVDTGVL